MTLQSWQYASIKLGMVGSTAIIANVSSGTLADIVSVTLNANYARSPDPAYPIADASSKALLLKPQTILAGTILEIYSNEAVALVNAGAASYTT